MAFATGISIKRVMDKLAKEFLVGRRMGCMALGTIAVLNGILGMGLYIFCIFGIVALFTEFF